MRISLKIETREVTVQTPGRGFMAAVDTVAALTKIGYWGDLYNRDAIDFLRTGVCLEDPELHIAGAVRCGHRTAFCISYQDSCWILRINVSKDKKPFASIEVQFNAHSGTVRKVILHQLPPANQVQWRL